MLRYQGDTFGLDLNHFEAVDEEIEAFDQHVNACVAATLESTLISRMKRCTKKECLQCCAVFEENAKFQDDFIDMQNQFKQCRVPCKCTVDIIKVSNKVFSMLENQIEFENQYSDKHDKILGTILIVLDKDELYPNSNFNWHDNAISGQHKVDFIRKVIYEYLKMKSCKVGGRISEQERGTYVRHNNKKRTHEAGQ